MVLAAAAALNFAAAFMALLALKPARARAAATESILPGAMGVSRV